MTKKEFVNHLGERWPLYLLSLILLSLLASWGIRLTAEPNKKEKVQVFIVSASSDTGDLYDNLNENMDDYLQRVEVESYDINNEYLYVYCQVYLGEADILILPDSLIEQYGVPNSINLDGVSIEGVIDENTEYYSNTEDGKYGIKVHTSGSENDLLSQYISYIYTDDDGNSVDENYYLFIADDSIHMGELTNAELSGGITVLKELFKDEN